MRHKINLLIKQKKYEETEKFLHRIKIALIGIATLSFLIVLFLLAITILQKKTLDSLYSQQKTLLEYSLSHKDEEAEFFFLRSKQKQLTTILKKDLDYARFFNTLKESLNVPAVGASLEVFSIDNKREATFSVLIKDLASLLSFIRFSDSDEFSKNFENLSMTNFTINKDAEENFILQFRGTFLP